ncbi:MAG: VWA domain-containing protein [Crocinitomicaceae bacterium]|nr:VWA domain-containing protein [Crocinitomicaceae bacterium]
MNIAVFEYEYTFKLALWLLLLIPALGFWLVYSDRKGMRFVNLSNTKAFNKSYFSGLQIIRYTNWLLLLAGLTFVILALARPYLPKDIEDYKKKNIEGIDIVIAMDVSSSMLARDFKPDRLESAKKVGIEFIEERPSDRIGLVVYEGEAFTQVPLTNDHELLIDLFEDIETGMVTPGTAIGTGLAVSVNRLIESDAKSKVVILLTDGMNNSGDIDPMDAARVAKQYGVCVYTIGVGTKGMAEVPISSFFGEVIYDKRPVEIDEELLTKIANTTGGKYFRATDEERLRAIYDEIDLLEKSKVKVLEYRMNPPEHYYGLLFWGLVLILLNRTLNYTLLKSVV